MFKNLSMKKIKRYNSIKLVTDNYKYKNCMAEAGNQCFIIPQTV